MMRIPVWPTLPGGTVTVSSVALCSLLMSGLCLAQGSRPAGTTKFALDGNRMYAELGFVRPDGSIHRALAFVDMGSPSMVLRESLFKDLQLDRRKLLVFNVGELSVEVPGADVTSESREPSSIGSELKVEAILPASILEKYRVVIDYRERTLELARFATDKPPGILVPIHINQRTGLIAVAVSINGKPYQITIDNGSAYTWVSQNAAKDWVVSHPEWKRGVGAIGASNMMMSGEPTETSGTLMRIPEISLGPLILKDVGMLAAGPSKNFPGNLDLFDWYARKNAVPVIGWIGGNILKAFRLTIDYPNQMTYWLKQSEPDTHDLDQVGLTLQSDRGAFFVAAVATRNGKPTVDSVLPGDKLIRVGALDTRNATWGAIYEAMHGSPGETRSLTIERNGHQITIATKVTAF